MKTYIWGCNDNYHAFVYEFLVVMAEDLNEARSLAIKQLEYEFNKKEYKHRFGKDSDEFKTVTYDHPIIIEPNTAVIIDHANE